MPVAPQPTTASVSGSPSATVSGSPPAPRLNQMGATPMAPRAQHATPRMSPVPMVASPTPTAAASPTATSGQSTVTVSYAVDEQVGDSFEAEIDVTNDGSSSISGWQIVVALPGDQVTELANATGYESNHILLLQPLSPGSAIAPGTTLRVYFVAQGTQTMPEICAFDNVSCG
jgi:cellulase/cellobiase CelA1